ncbi:hypothetical protein HDU93_006858 [Gonapodya sp. JEL0774]|nr:hypothetical protein HDU93_006858 [Gonapodya sp. JEL0774]
MTPSKGPGGGGIRMALDLFSTLVVRIEICSDSSTQACDKIISSRPLIIPHAITLFRTAVKLRSQVSFHVWNGFTPPISDHIDLGSTSSTALKSMHPVNILVGSLLLADEIRRLVS